MSRGYSAEYLESLHNAASLSVVQLLVRKVNSSISHLGTGVIVWYSFGCIGVITTISCDPESGYEVYARFADQSNIKAKVVLVGKLLSGLVIDAYDVDDEVVAVTEASFDDNIVKSEPVWAVGCFGSCLENIMPPGYIGVRNILKKVRKADVRTFVHSCSIGDGLIGAPIINQFGKIRGITVAGTPGIASMNYALRIGEIKAELARLANGANPQDSFSSILKKFGLTLYFKLRKAMKMGHASSSSIVIFKQSKKRKYN